MNRPLIGITADSEGHGEHNVSPPQYVLRNNYCEAIVNAGGTPVILPHNIGAIESYSSTLDGLLVSGGNFDIHPSHFGESLNINQIQTKVSRTEFELTIVKEMLSKNKPILGICGGQQLLHVVLGGTLVQHIPETITNALEHEQTNPRDEPSHTVKIKKNTLLHKIIGEDDLLVNSAHHQAAKDEPIGIVVNAVAPDGVIEGIEASSYKFCLGVQWHPEYAISKGDSKIFLAFVSAAQN